MVRVLQELAKRVVVYGRWKVQTEIQQEYNSLQITFKQIQT